MPTIFAYGPDAYRSRVFDRIGNCDVFGAAVLEDHELVWNKPNMKNKAEGLPNVRAAEGQAVHGLLFDMSPKQVELLEGYFGGYENKSMKVKPPKGGDPVSALVFVARRTGRKLGPTKANVDLSIKGAEDNGVPRDYVEQLRALQPIDG